MSENPDVLEYYAEKFEYVLVDEYQDTNKAQFTLVSILAARHGNITVVGDNDQGIYSFRGADISNILNFERDFPGTKIIKLEQNYRCSRHCLLLRLKEMGLISEAKIEQFNCNVIRGALEYGYSVTLYKPSNCKELIGDYNIKARQLYDRGSISQAKYFSLLYDMGIDLKKEE